MAIPTQCVFDLSPPNRPGDTDVQFAGHKTDEQPFEPNFVTDPCAAEDNQKSDLIVRYGTMVTLAKGSVHFAGSVPSINKLGCVRSTVSIATFTVTDNGVGDTTIAWPAGTFPTAVVDHWAVVTGAVAAEIACETLTNSLRVRTKDNAGAAVDVAFNFFVE